MNSLRILSTLALLHGVNLHVTHAQATKPVESAAPNTTTAAASEPVVMSPFTVATSSDQGYLATETQAGTRLRTQIADTPVALSILTNDFMNDIAATGLDSLVPFIPSTESFTLLGGDNSGNSAKTGDTLTVRGFKTNTRTRNFFQTLGFNDRYLTDRVTFSRGPNALLFGIGNPGGSVHIATNRAEFGNRHGELKYQYDSHGSHRLTFDQNYEVIDDRWALRVDALYEDSEGFREPTYDRKDGVFLTTTINPFDRDGKTQLRINYEHGKWDRVSARPWAPFDLHSNWVRLGAPLYNNRTAARPGVADINNPFIRMESLFIDIKGQPDDSIPTFYSARGSGYNSYVRAAGPIINGIEETDVSITSDFVSLNALDVLGAHFGSPAALETWLAGLGPHRSIPEAWSGGKVVTVPMETFFSGNLDTYVRDFDAASIFIEQRIGRNLFIELAGNFETADTNNLTMMRATDYSIQYDPNLYFPNGSPNPYAGMPYVGQIAFATDEEAEETIDEYRATLGYSLDLRNHRFLRFFDLGRHQLSALWNRFSNERVSLQERPYLVEWDGESIAGFNPNNARLGVLWNGTRVLGRYYLMPGQPSYIPEPWLPITGDGSVGRADWVNFSLNGERTDIDSYALSTQSFFFKDRLVVTAGWREDRMSVSETVTVNRPESAANPSAGEYFGEVDVAATRRNWQPLDDRSWRNDSYGVVLHLLKDFHSINRLGAFYNKATNVSGAVRRFDVYYNEVDPLQGEGEDYGLRFSLFNNRLAGSVSYYETKQTNNFVNSNSLEGRGVFWNAIRGVLGVTDPGELARRDASPESWVPIFDSTTTGYEFEVVWNATRNFRVRGTYSTHENVVDGFAADIERYLTENRPAWQAFIDANYDPNFPGPVNPNSPTPTEQLKLDGETAFLALADMDAELPLKKALNGVPTFGIPNWQASLSGTYTFPRASRLGGWSIGANVRHRGEAPLAFETNAAGVVDMGNSLEAEGATNIDLHVYYVRKIWNNRIDWRVQANLRNVTNDTDPIYLTGTWNRDTREFIRTRNRMQEPRTLVLSTSFAW